VPDQSYLDTKYFIDDTTYNCPFCNRRNLAYDISYVFDFDWSTNKKCYGYTVRCSSCRYESMHLSYDKIHYIDHRNKYLFNDEDFDIDTKIFYSVPTSFFVMDNRIPKIIRELITEAEGCLKMNYLTGASACMRKSIYELLRIERAKGRDYESRIKSLKEKYSQIDPSFFDILAQIQDMTSDKIHEQSWDKWDSPYLRFIIYTLKNILEEIYVQPNIRTNRHNIVLKMQEHLKKDKKSKRDSASPDETPIGDAEK